MSRNALRSQGATAPHFPFPRTNCCVCVCVLYSIPDKVWQNGEVSSGGAGFSENYDCENLPFVCSLSRMNMHVWLCACLLVCVCVGLRACLSPARRSSNVQKGERNNGPEILCLRFGLWDPHR